MTEAELRALILNDMQADALAAVAGAAMKKRAIQQAITAADPLATFKELLTEWTRRPDCPTCKVQLERMGVVVGSTDGYDRIDDQSQERTNSFVCPKCHRQYFVNNRSGKMTEMSSTGGPDAE